MSVDTVAQGRRSGIGFFKGALLCFLGAKLAGMFIREMSGISWWQNPTNRDLVATVLIVLLGGGIAAGVVVVARRAVVPAVVGFIGCIFKRDELAPAQVSRQMSEEAERKTMAHLLGGFQKDIFRIYAEPGLRAVADGDLPEGLKKVRGSTQHRNCAEFALGQAKSRMDDRLRDLGKDWDLRPEALDHLDCKVQASAQILMTCHTSIKSWQ